MAVDEVCGHLAARYKVPLAKIDPEVRGLIDQLLEEHLVEPTALISPQAP